MGWREYAREIQEGGDNRDDRDISPAPRQVAEATAIGLLRTWHGRLNGVDQMTAPSGWEPGRWATLIDASLWLYENYASQAVRGGWTDLDLFGVLHKPGRGGLADRLEGARNLKLSDDRAVWSSRGVRETFARGYGDDLKRAGLVPLRAP